MPRSVTRVVLIVGAPLVALTTVSILGSQPTRPVATRLAAGRQVASLRSLHAGASDFGRLPRGRDDAHAADPRPASASPRHRSLPGRRRSAPLPHGPTPPPVSAVGGAAGVEFSLVNQDRAANGVASLRYSASLARVAQYRAQDMLNRGYFSHYDPATGQLAFVQLLHLWGIPYSTAGENIAWSTNPSMAGINTMFMNSPDHRDNILKGAYHRMGIGVASNGAKIMVVEVFSN